MKNYVKKIYNDPQSSSSLSDFYDEVIKPTVTDLQVIVRTAPTTKVAEETLALIDQLVSTYRPRSSAWMR